ncbi:MAG: MFS transporter [Gordonia sp. (in: high G+C Gram-positive bacteria)]
MGPTEFTAKTPVTARVAVAGVFALNGFLAAMWVAHIPVIVAGAGVEHAELGGLLLLLGLSAFVGMQVCGRLIDRLGSRPVTIGAAAALSLAVCAPPASHCGWTLALALVAFGFCNGSLDVSMNTQAVEVQRCYGRPIMSAFHGWFSLGGLAGSGVVAATLFAGTGVPLTVAGAALLGLIAVAFGGRHLLSPARARAVASTEFATGRGRSWWREVDLRSLVLLAALAFGLMLAEGTAYDWSALTVVETFGTPDSVGAIAFAAFSAAMTVARFGIDPITARLGPSAVVRNGSLLGLVGVLVVVAAGTVGSGDTHGGAGPVLAIAGWILFGLGLAGGIPQIFTAAGELTAHAAGKAISMVVGVGYLGMLAGPALIGAIASRTSLSTSLLLVAALLAVAAVAAGAVDVKGQK